MERDVEIRPQTIRLSGDVELVFEGEWGRSDEKGRERWMLEVTASGKRRRIVFSPDGSILSIVPLTPLVRVAME